MTRSLPLSLWERAGLGCAATATWRNRSAPSPGPDFVETTLSQRERANAKAVRIQLSRLFSWQYNCWIGPMLRRCRMLRVALRLV